jgi:hypothetical protein
MLDTSLTDANKYPLKINDLVISACLEDKLPVEVMWSNSPLNKMHDLPNVALAGQLWYGPEPITASYLPYAMSVMAIDPSGRGEDETAYAVGKLASGNIFCPEAGGMQGGYSDETLIALCHVAKRHKVNKIVVESNFGDGMFTKLLTPHLNRIYPCSVEEVRQNAQKELRIISVLEPVMNQHRLIFDPRVIRSDYETAMERYRPDEAPKYMLFYQLARITKERGALKHDDRLDALAMMVQYFQDRLDADQHTEASRRKDEAWAKELETWVIEAQGRESLDHPELNFHRRMRDNIIKGSLK